MKKLFRGLARLLILAINLQLSNSHAQGTAFTYQGRLNSVGAPVNGSFDFQFIAYDNSVGGSQQGSIVTTNAAGVSNGLFTVTLNFGSIFTGAARWLDISVRTNGAASYTVLSPRQNLTPAPYAVYASNAGNAATANNFSGSLAGDVTGTQAATVVSSVGGQTAANVAAGAVAVNAATLNNNPGTIVRRDASGNFFASAITATTFNGSGANLTSLNAANVSSGTLADARLSSNVPLLNANQSFTGSNSFNGGLAANTGAGTLSVINDGTQTAGLLATGGPNPGYLRVRNALQIFPNQAQTAAGLLDVRNTGGAATITLNGANGNVAASSVNASSINGGFGSDFSLNDHALRLRNDPNHGLGYNGAGVTNFPNGSVLPDGPVLWGFSGGALGVMNGGAKSALSWDNSGVTVSGNFTANNTPGVNYAQVSLENINVPNNTTIGLASEGNAKVAPGYFVITAYVTGFGEGHQMSLKLLDVSGSPILLTSSFVDTVVANSSSAGFTLSLSWVVPITVANGYQNFGLQVSSAGPGSGNAAVITGHNLTVLYVPRLNN